MITKILDFFKRLFNKLTIKDWIIIILIILCGAFYFCYRHYYHKSLTPVVVYNTDSLETYKDKIKTEYTGEKYDCKPYRWKFNESLQKSYKEEIKLDKDKRYIVAYVDKCRSGRDHQYLIYQFDGHLATYRELGFCTIVPDERR